MAHQRPGHRAEARRWLEEAKRWTAGQPPGHWRDALELRLFRCEADALIRGTR